MPVTTFLIAAVLALPKQFATVYLGYAENVSADGKKSKSTTIAKIVVITVTILVTIWSMHYVNGQIDQIKGRVVYARRKACQAKLEQQGVGNVGAREAEGADPEDPATAPLVGGEMDNVGLAHPSPSRTPEPPHRQQYSPARDTNPYRTEGEFCCVL